MRCFLKNLMRPPGYEHVVITCTSVRLAGDRYQIVISARKPNYFAARLSLVMDSGMSTGAAKVVCQGRRSEELVFD